MKRNPICFIGMWLLKKSYLGVHELDKFGKLSSEQMTHLRKQVDILLIDDEDAETLAGKLHKQYGYCHIKTVNKQPDDSLLNAYPIIITDVRGISDENSNGLKFAKLVKQRYPLKQIIISSGQLKVSEYREDLRESRLFNGIYDKVKNDTSKLAGLLDVCIQNLYDPSLLWREIRSILLDNKDLSKSDQDILSIAKMEDEFVRTVIAQRHNSLAEDTNLLDILIKSGKIALCVLDLIKGIKAL